MADEGSATADYLKQGLIYDLRQKWAEMLGSDLLKILEARDEDNFIDWFRYLKNLHMDISYKFKKEDKLAYKKLLEEITDVIKINSFAFESKKAGDMNRGVIRDKLSELHQFLISMMDKHKLFGSPEELEEW